MNLQDLWRNCGALLNDRNNERWSQETLTERLNLAQTEVATATKVLEEKSNLTFIANQARYSVDTNDINIVRVVVERLNGGLVTLQGTTREELDFDNPGWQNWGAGDPRTWYYEDASQEIVFVPAPDANAASVVNPVELTTIQKIADMTVAADIPFAGLAFMIPFHMALVHWAVAYCWMDDATPEALAKSKFHKSDDKDKPGQYDIELARVMGVVGAPIGSNVRIMWKPQGNRYSRYPRISKAYPFR